MSYEVGVSSGFWQIGRDPSLLGLSAKAGFIATAGVTFNQVDLETMAEFLEPKVKDSIKRIKKELGLKIGLHAEIGKLSALEAAERRIWDQAHDRLVETVKNAVEVGIVYINFHLSSEGNVQFTEAQSRLQGYFNPVVTPEGKPFWTLAEKSKAVKERILAMLDTDGGSRPSTIFRLVADEPVYRKMVEEENRKFDEIAKKRTEELERNLERDETYRNLPDFRKREEKFRLLEAIREQVSREFRNVIYSPEFVYRAWTKTSFPKYVLEAGEVDAYLLVAESMKEFNDVLWKEIAKNKGADEAYETEEKAFNAAVAARYLEGHLTLKDHPKNKDLLGGKSVLEWAKEHNLILTFEMPEKEDVPEGLYRLYDPRHAYWFVKKLNSPVIKLCIDFEHMLAQRLDPYKVIPELAPDFGKYVYLFHLGEPKPYFGKAHIPIPLGSQAQEIIYEWLYMMRKLGFKDGLLIFERGGGRTGSGRSTYEVYENSVIALKLIAKYLAQDVKPDRLPLDFYGMSEQNEPEFARQRVNIVDHAWDPLEGVLSVPEEKHTFLSRAAVEKQKGQEWEKRKFR